MTLNLHILNKVYRRSGFDRIRYIYTSTSDIGQMWQNNIRINWPHQKTLRTKNQEVVWARCCNINNTTRLIWFVLPFKWNYQFHLTPHWFQISCFENVHIPHIFDNINLNSIHGYCTPEHCLINLTKDLGKFLRKVKPPNWAVLLISHSLFFFSIPVVPNTFKKFQWFFKSILCGIFS